METEISRDIRKYSEQIYFGLTLRQILCSCLAIAAAVIVWFVCSELLGSDLTPMVCGFAAVPFAAMGFIPVNNRTFERFVLACLKYWLTEPKNLNFKTGDLVANLMRADSRRMDREMLKQDRIPKEKKG